MKAWELEYNTMAAATPLLCEQAGENWLKYEEAGNQFDEKLKKDWYSAVPGSEAPCQLVVAAVQAMENRGYDVSEAEALLPEGLLCLRQNDLPGLNAVTAKIHAALRRAPKNTASEYWRYKEYFSFADVLAEVDFGPEAGYSPLCEEYPALVENAWRAQLVGSAVGTQMEGYVTPQIVKAYGRIDRYLREPETYNDDLTYAITFLDVFAQKGYDITSEDIAYNWARLVPDGYSAEETALWNIRSGILPPESGRQGNYFYDWIGAQMRTALIGVLAPGQPGLAAELAWRDSVVSHANNGALGGVFNAVLASLAFTQSDVQKLVQQAVSLMPGKSQYRAIVQDALTECQKGEGWQNAWQALEERNKRYHWIHAYPNAAAEVVALWYGQGDFDETLNIICQAGRDTDCNAGQILTVLGAMGRPIGEKWLAPLGPVVKTYMRAYRQFTLEEMAQKTVQAARDAFSRAKTQTGPNTV